MTHCLARVAERVDESVAERVDERVAERVAAGHCK